MGPGTLPRCVNTSSWRPCFSQSETDVKKKLDLYVTHHPRTVAIFKIKVKETLYVAPSQEPSSAIVKRFIDEPMLKEAQFGPAARTSGLRKPFRVVRDDITWIDVMGVDIELWLRLGDKPIDLHVNSPNDAQTAYTSGASIVPRMTTRTI